MCVLTARTRLNPRYWRISDRGTYRNARAHIRPSDQTCFAVSECVGSFVFAVAFSLKVVSDAIYALWRKGACLSERLGSQGARFIKTTTGLNHRASARWYRACAGNIIFFPRVSSIFGGDCADYFCTHALLPDPCLVVISPPRSRLVLHFPA